MRRAKPAYLWCLLVAAAQLLTDAQNLTENEIRPVRPYEFTFNIADFQHRSEKKDDDGLITGEYGFVTADGIYHETAYATDKDGDFIITKMRHRKIINSEDVEEIFKDNPEEAKALVEALLKSSLGHEIPELELQETSSFVKAETTTVIPKNIEINLENKLDLAAKEMIQILNKKSGRIETANGNNEFLAKEKKLFGRSNRLGKELSPPFYNATSEIIRDMVDAGKKVFASDFSRENESDKLASLEALEKMANDLFYRFNYTFPSHGQWEDGFRNGRKDGEYNAKFKEGVVTNVKYVSNEFGHQPNITLVADRGAGADEALNATTDKIPHKKHYFSWFNK